MWSVVGCSNGVFWMCERGVGCESVGGGWWWVVVECSRWEVWGGRVWWWDGGWVSFGWSSVGIGGVCLWVLCGVSEDCGFGDMKIWVGVGVWWNVERLGVLGMYWRVCDECIYGVEIMCCRCCVEVVWCGKGRLDGES